MLVVIALGFTLSASPASSTGPTNVSGTIASNTTWTLANSPYVMTGDVTVASGVTLTIEPGVVVQGNSVTRTLTVNGSLSAVGSSSQHITFTSTSDSAAGQWYQISFGSGSGTSSLDYVDVRYGGDGDISATHGMVAIAGGTVTVDHSTFKDSTVSGMSIAGTSTGSGVSVTIRHTLFERNGFDGSSRHGHGLYVVNAPVTIEDSAFFSNAKYGIFSEIGTSYAQSPAQISGTSIWDNREGGVNLLQGSSSVASLAADGHISGKPGNAIYDNGSFGFSQSEPWTQLTVSYGSTSVDWSGNYWGPVREVPCGFGSQTGQLSFSVPDPNPSAANPLERGPVTHGVDGSGFNYCGNDSVTTNPPALDVLDLFIDPPPPIAGGLPRDTTDGNCERTNQAAYSHKRGAQAYDYLADPINTASGGLSETNTDLQLAGPGIPIAWMRTYNSFDTSAGSLGPGWTHPYEANLTVANQSTGELDYVCGTGQHTHFTQITGGSSGSATYGAKGFDGSMKRLSDNSYQLTTPDQRLFSFDSSGKLTQIKPRFLPATTLSYTSGKLTSITDSAGRTITLSYLATDPSLIEKVTLPDNRYVQYGYMSGRLTSVQDARGKTWTISYDGNGRLTSIQDPVGHYQVQQVQYDGQGRVTSEQNGTGATTSVAYSTSAPYDVTTVTIPDRGSWVYRYRGYMLFNVTDPLNHTTSFTYDAMARRATTTDPRGYTRRVEYDAYGNVVKEVAPQPLGYTIQRTFNATNDLLTETDGRGNTTTYAYATSSDPAADYQTGQLKTITDRENGVTTYKYWTSSSTPTPPSTNVGLRKSISNARSKITSYDYDSSGNLTKITSPLGLKTTYGYDSSGRKTSERDPRGNVPNPPSGYLTQWAYDNVDHVTSVTDARNNVTSYAYYDNELLHTVTRTESDSTQRVTTYEYDGANRLWKTTDPRSGVETRLYWGDDQLKSVQSPEGNKTSYGYDNAGRVTSVVEPNGNVTGATASDWTWSYGYDDAGNRTSESHPDAGTTAITYDALNRPTQWTDPLTHAHSVGYDANSNITSRTDALNHSRSYGYDKLDRRTSETDERSKTWTYTYFATGQLASITTPLGNKTTYALDDDGRRTSMVEPRGNVSGGNPSQYTWAYQYDEAGNRTRVTDPLNNAIQYAYDATNNLTQITDQRSNSTAFSYDTMNRLATVTPPAAGGTGTLATSYSYDAAGNLAGRTDPNSHTTSWSYDLDHRLTQKTTPIGSWNRSYDAAGNLKRLETPAGSSTQTAGDGTISYSYDRMSRLTGVDYSDSTPDVSRGYDNAGRLTSMSDANGSVSYSYDNADRLTDITRTGGGSGLNGTLHYDYDNAGNITGRSYLDSTSYSQSFDDDGRLTSITSNSQTTSFSYDEAGNLTTTTLPSGNGYSEARSYDRAGRLTTLDNAKAGTSLSKFQWTLDAAGNPTKAQATRGGTDSYDAYEYDTRNRLTASCYAISSSATDCGGASNEITYNYDKVANRTQEVRTGNVGNTGTITYSYNSADQLSSTSKGGTTTNYSYDTNGNQTASGNRSFTYNLANQLTSTTLSGTTTSYTYDGDGNRTSSTTSGGGTDNRYIWDPLAETGIRELALEQTTTGGLVRRYLNGPLGATAFTNSSATFYYHHDPINNVTDVTDSSGAAQWKYEYEPYGAERTTINVSGTAPANRLRFNNQYLDPETTTYNLRARNYDPTIGRLDALDPLETALPQAEGAYVYANAAPTTRVDPTGLRSDPWGPAGQDVAGPPTQPVPWLQWPQFDPQPSPGPCSGTGAGADPGKTTTPGVGGDSTPTTVDKKKPGWIEVITAIGILTGGSAGGGEGKNPAAGPHPPERPPISEPVGEGDKNVPGQRPPSGGKGGKGGKGGNGGNGDDGGKKEN